MSNLDEVAFPVEDESMSHVYLRGFTKREYAAIKLKVPNSGNEELNDMITESRRLDIAAQCLAGTLAKDNGDGDIVFGNPDKAGHWAFQHADALIAQSKEVKP